MTKALIELYPVEWSNARTRAADMVEAAKAHRLPIHGAVATRQEMVRGRVMAYVGSRATSRPAEYREVEDWTATLIALADLRAYAESIGQRPGFLFADGPVIPLGRGAPDPRASEDTEGWMRGIRHVAFDAAKDIVDGGNKLTAGGLEKAIGESPKVEFKNNEYHLKTTDASLNDRETKVKQKTIAGWVTELKKLLKQ